jgi:hypothetical protein
MEMTLLIRDGLWGLDGRVLESDRGTGSEL